MLREHFESLEQRQLLAVTALFIPGAGILTVFGDAQNNSIVVSRDAAGKILVNNGAVAVKGGTATVANTALIELFGLGGDDNLSLNEANGALPRAFLFGDGGNDVLIGGSGADQLFGQSGNDQLLGKGGNDFLFGGDGSDALTGGTGDDQVFGQGGNDRMIWNPGEGSDLNEGGDGFDTVEVNGGNGAEAFSVVANGTRVRFDRVSPAPFFIDIGTSESLTLNANGGDDAFTAGNGLATLISLTVDGGAGNDSITGGDGNDLLLGGDGNDLIVGGRGLDTALMGAGDDTFVWNPGDGSDVVEGQDGFDTMVFNGANISEMFDFSANGGRLRFTRNIGAVTMDSNDVERVNLNVFGGADLINVNDLSGTDVTEINISLENIPGSGTGDLLADSVVVNGSNGNDNVAVIGSGVNYSIVGLAAAVNVSGTDSLDQLSLNLLGGNDIVTGTSLQANVVKLTIDGGIGNDQITGSQGADLLIGGDGSDLIIGGRGDDTALMGADNDTFVWSPGDGNDIVEGQDGFDTMLFNGANIAEKFDFSANGSRLRFTRDVANIVMDTNAVEQVNLNVLGGADLIAIHDLAGTGVSSINLNLAATGGGGDGAADSVIVDGTANADNILVASNVSGGVKVGGLGTAINISFPEADDQLVINALGGDDTVDASALAAGVMDLTINGGIGNDILIGSQGDDLILGNQGNDTELMGAGDDTSVWNPGDGSDVVEGQAGQDTMVFNGANIAEKIELSANGGRLRFTRDVASIVMDTNDLEVVNFTARGGADQITVGDLSGTDVTEVDLNLESTPGSGIGDGAADTVIVEGSLGADVANVVGDASGVSILGLSAQVNIVGAEAANDRLIIDVQDGDDVIEATGLAANGIQFQGVGGNGDDILIGGAGNDILIGGAGDDVLFGGPGLDVLDGAPGNDILIQD